MRAIEVSVAAGVMLALGGLSVAQTVEFRVVERTNQTSLSGADSTLDIAVQARVVNAPPGTGLRSFGFDIRALCEADAWGTLSRGRINNADGTYVTTLGVSETVGLGGLAAQYAYLAETEFTANGLLNASGGTHVNNVSAQDIGSVRGLAQGPRLVKVLDHDGNSVPDTSPQNALGAGAPDGSTAELDSAASAAYFAGGQFVDVYRFRYSTTKLSCRTIVWELVPTETPTLFSQMQKEGGEWKATVTPAAATLVTPLVFIPCLNLPCRGDYNRDQVVAVQDIFDYINGWFSACVGQSGAPCLGRSADTNCDGEITVQDLFDFLNRWLGPC